MVGIANAASRANGLRGTRATLTRAQPREVPAHGGKLVNRLVHADEAADLLLRAKEMPRVRLDPRAGADAELVATGVLSPLEGFLGKDDALSVIRDARLSSGDRFPLPVTLAVPRAEARTLREGHEAALVDASGETVGTIAVDELYALDHVAELGVGVGVGGRIRLARRTIARAFPRHHRDPAELRGVIAARGWRRTVGLQTRGPVQRTDESLLRSALETADGIVVQLLVGDGDDAGAAGCVRDWEELLEGHFPEERVLLSVAPLATRHADPREALLHAIAAQNYGFEALSAGQGA